MAILRDLVVLYLHTILCTILVIALVPYSFFVYVALTYLIVLPIIMYMMLYRRLYE